MRLYSLAFLLFCCHFLDAQNKITIESLRTLPAVSTPQLSPDGKYLLYMVRHTDVANNNYQSVLMLLDIEKNNKFELKRGVSDPKWAPNGLRITYRTTFGGVYGVYASEFVPKKNKPRIEPPVLLATIHSTGHFLGHPTRKNYAWSPDGQFIAFVSADTASCSRNEDPNAPYITERTLYKTRTSFTDNCLTKIYLATRTGRLLKCLTPGPFDSHSLSWSADSKHVTFLSNRTADPDLNYNNELWTVNIDNNELIQLTSSIGTEHEPSWSSSGKIAYPATIRERNTKDSPPENTFIYTMDPMTKKTGNITASLDRRATSPQWHPDGEWLYFLARDQGKRIIYRVKEGTDPVPVIDKLGTAGDFHVGKDQLVYVFSSPDRPAEVYASNLDGTESRQLTFESFSWRAGKDFGKVESFWFSSFDGTKVQGFIAYPEKRGAGKIPVVHRIHGGPHGMYGYSFSDFNELLVSQGYAVVFINPRGSTGYGQKFADGTYQAWGGGDYKDLMLGIDAALEKYDFLDGERMVVTGGSYGGFMTNWVITQTDRYKAAATVASVSNLISFYGTSLYQLLIETEFNGLPWDNYDLLWHFSPMRHIDNVKTPTLLLHGENDNDVHITQAEEFYIGLKKMGVPARFVRYPNEGHGVRQPQHREHYYQEILNWFNKFL